MIDLRTAAYAALLLRLSLGIMFLAHAAAKLFILTPAGTERFFGSLGLPTGLAYVVMTVEVLGGVALILGVWARLIALGLTPILLGAIATVHAANGWLFTNPNGGWEFPAFWIVGLVALVLMGDGAWASIPTPALDRAPLLHGA